MQNTVWEYKNTLAFGSIVTIYSIGYFSVYYWALG